MILTVDKYISNHRNVAGIACRVVHAKGFHINQLGDVRADVRQQLLSKKLHRYDSSVMSNNNTVNIFLNHVMLWQQVAESNTTTLILEDDAIPTTDHALLSLLDHMNTQVAVQNYIMKLQNSPLHSFFGWSPKEVGNYTLYQCTCRPPVVNSGLLAYVLDPMAARTLLRIYKPIWTHVDTWIHHIGCAEHVTLLSTVDSMFIENGRPSFHRTGQEVPSVVEKIVHIAHDALHSNCGDQATRESS